MGSSTPGGQHHAISEMQTWAEPDPRALVKVLRCVAMVSLYFESNQCIKNDVMVFDVKVVRRHQGSPLGIGNCGDLLLFGLSHQTRG